MKKFLGKIPWILATVALISLLVYGFWPEPVDVDLVQVVRGSLEVTINDDGETRIREKYIVSAPVTGKMLRIELQAGDTVKQGITELVRIEPGDAALLDARTQAVYKARENAAAAAVQQSEAILKRTEEAKALADHSLQRAQRLLPQQAISGAEFDATEHRQHIAAADVRSAEFALKVAQFELEYARVAAARFDPDNSMSWTTPIRLVAPIDGRVLQVFREDAMVVAPGTALLKLGDPQDLEIEIDVLSTDAVRIEPGDKVYIDHWGGDKILQAIVRLVEPSAFLKVSALGVEEKRVNVIADFVDPWSDRQTLGDGFRIEAGIVVSSTAQDSCKVASGTLVRDRDLWIVYRVVGGIAQRTIVEPGETNGLQTEIKKGLSVGDLVILHPTDQIGDGVRVSHNN